jgi:hypothetical protein
MKLVPISFLVECAQYALHFIEFVHEKYLLPSIKFSLFFPIIKAQLHVGQSFGEQNRAKHSPGAIKKAFGEQKAFKHSPEATE